MKNFISVKQNAKTITIAMVALAVCILLTIVQITAMGENRIKATASPSDDMLAQIEANSSALDQTSCEYDNAVAKVAQCEQEAAECQEQITDCENQISALRGKICTRVKSTYINGSAPTISLLLESKNPIDFLNNFNLVNKINQEDAIMVSKSVALHREAKEKKEDLDSALQEAETNAQIAKENKENAEAIISNLRNQYEQLSAAEAAAVQQQANNINSSATADTGGNSGDDGGGGQVTPGPTPTPDPGPTPAGSIAGRAQQELGKPYAWGAVGPEAYDCSGLVSYCLTGVHARIGTTGTFMGWPRVSNPSPGDVCTSSSHCGIYMGPGSMIHAPTFGAVVSYGGIQSGMIIVRY